MLLYNSLPHLPSTKGVSGPFQGHLIPGNTMGQEFHARLRAVTEAFGPEQNTSENTAGFPRHMLHLCYILVHIPYLVRIYDLSIFHHGYLYIYILHIIYICFINLVFVSVFFGKHLIWGDLFIGPHPRFWGVELPLEKLTLKIKDNNLIVLAD